MNKNDKFTTSSRIAEEMTAGKMENHLGKCIGKVVTYLVDWKNET